MGIGCCCFLMLFDLVAQLFQLEALLKYVDYAYALAMTFIVLRYLHQVIDGLYLWKFQQLKKEGKWPLPQALTA